MEPVSPAMELVRPLDWGELELAGVDRQQRVGLRLISK